MDVRSHLCHGSLTHIAERFSKWRYIADFIHRTDLPCSFLSLPEGAGGIRFAPVLADLSFDAAPFV